LSRDPTYSEFEHGERRALLEVRSFITKHGTKQVDDYCAQRLHDIAMDARHNASKRGEQPIIEVTVAAHTPPQWFMIAEIDGEVRELKAAIGEPLTVPAGSKILHYGPVPLPDVTLAHSISAGTKDEN
jgi:hypothetical protein